MSVLAASVIHIVYASASPQLHGTIIKPFECTLQLLEVMNYLHNHWIVHRDLKLSNLLLTNDGCLKLCDYGLARYFKAYEEAYTPKVVTLWYRLVTWQQCIAVFHDQHGCSRDSSAAAAPMSLGDALARHILHCTGLRMRNGITCMLQLRAANAFCQCPVHGMFYAGQPQQPELTCKAHCLCVPTMQSTQIDHAHTLAVLCNQSFSGHSCMLQSSRLISFLLSLDGIIW